LLENKEFEMTIQQQARRQAAVETIRAEGARRLYSEISTQFVRNGQGIMSQRYFAEQQAARAAAY
jgi:hypothetical protein